MSRCLPIVLFAVPASARELKTAVFAGGCFWCMEPPFDELDGVVATTSGYTGGRSESPTYKQVTFGDTGHLESVKVTYDADKVDYATLLEVYWRNIDPVDDLGQFCDKGSSYRAAIFVDSDAERELAERTKSELEGEARRGVRHAHPAAHSVLRRRGLPSGLLSEESGAL